MKKLPVQLLSLLAAAAAAANSRQQHRRQSQQCPNIHIFGARETTLPQSNGFGTGASVISSIQQANSGQTVTTEAIVYPAAGGNSYASSVTAGIAAVASQVTAFNAKCPNSKIVMVGYSQGSQIMDDAFCGGPDQSSLNTTAFASQIPEAAGNMVAALIWMGDPRHVAGLSYNVGTATQGGFAARPAGFDCPDYASRIQSYCDSADPFCAKGNDQATHQGYAKEYGQQALQFVQTKLSALSTGNTTSSNTSGNRTFGMMGTTNTTSASVATTTPSSIVPSSGATSLRLGWMGVCVAAAAIALA